MRALLPHEPARAATLRMLQTNGPREGPGGTPTSHGCSEGRAEAWRCAPGSHFGLLLVAVATATTAAAGSGSSALPVGCGGRCNKESGDVKDGRGLFQARPVRAVAVR